MNPAPFFFAVLLSLALALFQCQPPQQAISQATPEATVKSLIMLAQLQQLEPLSQFCDPQGRNDGDTDCICALSADYQPHTCPTKIHNQLSKAQFIHCFASAAISGDITYLSETQAQVPFRAHPEVCGFANETMNLIAVDQRWYLESF